MQSNGPGSARTCFCWGGSSGGYVQLQKKSGSNDNMTGTIGWFKPLSISKPWISYHINSVVANIKASKIAATSTSAKHLRIEFLGCLFKGIRKTTAAAGYCNGAVVPYRRSQPGVLSGTKWWCIKPGDGRCEDVWFVPCFWEAFTWCWGIVHTP